MSHRLNKFLSRHLTPPLVTAGFVGEDGNYFRDREWCLDLVQVQESKRSLPQQPTFTINAGIFVPEIHQLLWGDRPTSGVTSCLLRHRIGDFVDADSPRGGLDKWWTLEIGNEAAVGAELEGLTRNFVQFLDSVHSLEALRGRLQEAPRSILCEPSVRLGMAALSARTGDRDAAKIILDEMRKERRMHGWKQNIDAVAKRLGLDTENPVK